MSFNRIFATVLALLGRAPRRDGDFLSKDLCEQLLNLLTIEEDLAYWQEKLGEYPEREEELERRERPLAVNVQAGIIWCTSPVRVRVIRRLPPSPFSSLRFEVSLSEAAAGLPAGTRLTVNFWPGTPDPRRRVRLALGPIRIVELNGGFEDFHRGELHAYGALRGH